jgi:hypothetical protein
MNDDDDFSAWSLPVDDEAPPTPVMPVKPAALSVKLSGDAKPAPVFTALSSVSPAHQGNPVGSVESRIRALPPLQQGIIWAEILGAPKGL